ncbi:MAG TPA: hypothetical protein VH208_00495, partial [Myxococcaceae bacterium]|nr:hypothetical protein [Myxococcaceae bacterium]
WTEAHGPVGPYGHWERESTIIVPQFERQPTEEGEAATQRPGALEVLDLLRRMGLDGEVARAFHTDGKWLASILSAKTDKTKLKIAEALRASGLLMTVTRTEFGENPRWQLEQARRELEAEQARQALQEVRWKAS